MILFDKTYNVDDISNLNDDLNLVVGHVEPELISVRLIIEERKDIVEEKSPPPDCSDKITLKI